MTKTISADYLRDNFDPQDRLAVVLLNKRTGHAIQRLAPAKEIAAPDFQAWLHDRNAIGNDIYISISAIQPQAGLSQTSKRSVIFISILMTTARRR